MKTINAFLGAALLAGSSMAHVAIKPPTPDRWLTPDSSTAPAGCKLLGSDKGFPSEEEVLKQFPKIFRKMKGTEGPDFFLQPQTVADVQKAVNFAREKNIRLNIITSGHDFHGREDSRSGLRLDMAAFIQPTVFANSWKCGDNLRPTVRGKVVEETISCKVPNQKRNVGRGIAGRGWDYVHFEKRDGEEQSCETLLKRHVKRHGPDGADDGAGGHAHGDNGAKVPAPPTTPASLKRHVRRHGPDGAEDGMGGHAHGDAGAKVPAPPTTPATPNAPVPIVAPPNADVKYDPAKPYEWGQKTGFTLPAAAQIVDGFNKIRVTGDHAYARIPGGMYNEKFFLQAHANGLMSLGAQHGGVSTLGGWMQAGGHNPFANVHGMMVDNVVELEVVTADGKFQKASECENKDLFWALRGGGGGTFGVVTGGTVKVYPTFPIVVTRFFVNSTKMYDPKIMNAAAHFLQQGAKARDKYGLQGYFYIYPNAFHSVLHMPGKYATLENAKAATAELQGKMEQIAGAKHIEAKYYQYKSYKDWYVAEMGDEEMEETGQQFLSWYDGSYGDAPSAEDVMMNPMLVIPFKLEDAQREAKSGKLAKREAAEATKSVLRTQPQGRTYLDSRLLSDKHVNSVTLDQLGKGLLDVFPRSKGNHYRGFLYGGGAMAKPAKDDMGLLPQWRDMTYHLIINAIPGSSRHDYNVQSWNKLFPDAGAYVNEASPGEPEWKKRYWGDHYAKLESIKKKVDPKNVFWCSPCVGADMLTYDDERLCKNANYPSSGPAPQTYANPKSKVGIASLPGREGIANPLAPIIDGWMKNKTLPSKMPASSYFKIAMGQGGSSGGRWSLGDPKTGAVPAQSGGHGHGDMEGMGMGQMGGAPVAEPAKQNPNAIETARPTGAKQSGAKQTAPLQTSPVETPVSSAPAAEPTAKGKTGSGIFGSLGGKGKGTTTPKTTGGKGKTTGSKTGLGSKTGKAGGKSPFPLEDDDLNNLGAAESGVSILDVTSQEAQAVEQPAA